MSNVEVRSSGNWGECDRWSQRAGCALAWLNAAMCWLGRVSPYDGVAIIIRRES